MIRERQTPRLNADASDYPFAPRMGLPYRYVLQNHDYQRAPDAGRNADASDFAFAPR